MELSYKHQLTHVSSCLNTVNLLAWIYDQRKDGEPVVLGNSHAALALYVVLEFKGLCDAEHMVHKYGTHASRDTYHGIWVSGGSLGQPETVAVGMALANKNRKVWLVTSDGACMEGAVHEVARMSWKCPNLSVHVVFNGLGAYGTIGQGDIPRQFLIYYVDFRLYPEWLRGLPGHYLKLTKEQHDELMA